MIAFVLLPFTILKYFFNLLKYFFKIINRFDKYLLADIIGFLVMTSFSIGITYFLHLMMYESRILHHILIGIFAVSIIFSIIHKLIQLPKKYNWYKIYRRPEPKQESQNTFNSENKAQQENEDRCKPNFSEESIDFTKSIEELQIIIKQNNCQGKGKE